MEHLWAVFMILHSIIKININWYKQPSEMTLRIRKKMFLSLTTCLHNQILTTGIHWYKTKIVHQRKRTQIHEENEIQNKTEASRKRDCVGNTTTIRNCKHNLAILIVIFFLLKNATRTNFLFYSQKNKKNNKN